MNYRVFAISLAIVFTSFISCNSDKPQKLNNHNKSVSAADSIKMIKLIEQSKTFLCSNPDSSCIYSDSLIQLANTTNDIANIAMANKLFGNIYNIKSDYSKSIDFYNKALNGFQEIGDSSNIGRINMNIGICYLDQSKFSKVKEQFIKAEKFLSGTKDQTGLQILYSNFSLYYNWVEKYDSAMIYLLKAQRILDQTKNGNPGDLYGKMGVLYLKMGNFDLAKDFLLNALKISERDKNDYATAPLYINLANLYLNTGRLRESLRVLNIAEQLSKNLGNNFFLAGAYNNFGTTYYLLGNYKKSQSYFEQSLSLYDKVKDNSVKTVALLCLAEIYQALNDSIKSKHYIDEGYALAGDLKTKVLIENSYKQYSDFYFKSGNYKKAYEFSRKQNAIKDSILNKEKIRIVEELNTKYETEKKEKELLFAGFRLRTQKITIFTLSAGILLLIASLSVIVVLYRKKTYSNIELVKRNKELSELKKGSGKEKIGNGLKVTEEKIESLIQDLKYIMEVEKAFLDPELTLSSLAIKLKTNREYLSQVLNNVIGNSFTDYLNDFRIEEAKSILTEQANKKSQILSISGIANVVGFKNTSTFNPIFKRITGLTPSEYKKASEKVSESTNS